MHRSYATHILTSLENGVYVMLMLILAEDKVIRICVNSRRRKRTQARSGAHRKEWLSVDENKSQKFSVQKLNNLLSFDSITYAVI